MNIPWRCRASVCLSRSARNICITPSTTCSTLARSYRRHEQHLVGVLHNMPLRIRATPARAHAANAPSWSSSFCMHAYVTLSTDARTSKTFTFTFTLTLTFTPLPVQLPAPPTLHTCTTSCINAHSAQHGPEQASVAGPLLPAVPSPSLNPLHPCGVGTNTPTCPCSPAPAAYPTHAFTPACIRRRLCTTHCCRRRRHTHLAAAACSESRRVGAVMVLYRHPVCMYVCVHACMHV